MTAWPSSLAIPSSCPNPPTEAPAHDRAGALGVAPQDRRHGLVCSLDFNKPPFKASLAQLPGLAPMPATLPSKVSRMAFEQVLEPQPRRAGLLKTPLHLAPALGPSGMRSNGTSSLSRSSSGPSTRRPTFSFHRRFRRQWPRWRSGPGAAAPLAPCAADSCSRAGSSKGAVSIPMISVTHWI